MKFLMLLRLYIIALLVGCSAAARADLSCEIAVDSVPDRPSIVSNPRAVGAALRGGLDFLLLPVTIGEANRALALPQGTAVLTSGEGLLPVTDGLSSAWINSSEADGQIFAVVSGAALGEGAWSVSGGFTRVGSDRPTRATLVDSHSGGAQIRDVFQDFTEDQTLRGKIRYRLHFPQGISLDNVVGFLTSPENSQLILPLRQNIRRLRLDMPVAVTNNLDDVRALVRTGGLPND